MPKIPLFSARFVDHLDTNYVPTDSELSELRSILQEPQQRLRALEEEIQKLQVQRDELATYITRYQQLLSPYRRIPADVWGEIFVHTLPDHPPYRTVHEAPLLFTSICRSWREIALRTPRLWNSIHIHLPSQQPSLHLVIQKRKSGAKRWLERSGSLPITFSISVLHTDEDDDSLAVLAAFTELLAHFSYRLKVVRLSHIPEQSLSLIPEQSSIHHALWKPLTDLTQRELPMLEDFSVTLGLFVYNRSSTSRGWVLTPLASLLTRVGSLRTLCITNEHISSFLDLPIRWGVLNRLEIKSESHSNSDPMIITTLVKISKSCSSLSYLSLWLGVTTNSFHEVVWLPQIASFRHLKLVVQSPCSPGSLHHLLTSTFQSIVTPNLESLTFFASPNGKYDPAGYSPFITPFHDMLAKSGCQVRHLSLDEATIFHIDALFESFRVLPGLSSLQLRFRRDPSDSTDADGNEDASGAAAVLQLLQTDSSLCPELEDVDVECHPKDVDIDTVVNFLGRRPRISSFVVNFGDIEEGSDEEGVITADPVGDSLKGERSRGKKILWKWKSVPPRFEFSYYDRPGSENPESGSLRQL